MRLKNFPAIVSLGFALLFSTFPTTQSHGEEISFGKVNKGLAVGVMVDRTRIRPGKRLIAHVFVKNTTDQPLKLIPPWPESAFGEKTKVPYLVGWNVESKMEDCRVAKTDKPDWGPTLEDMVTVPPKSTALLLSEQIQSAFDLSNDGEYRISFTVSLERSDLPKGDKGDQSWAEFEKKGIWRGSCRSADATFFVTPKADVHGELRKRKIQIQSLDEKSGWINLLQGDSILYRGQVLSTNSGKRLRVLRMTEDFKSWEVKPVPPLKLDSLKEGGHLNADEEDFHWVRSVKNNGSRKSPENLKLELKLKKTKLTPAEGWEGEVHVVNTGSAPVVVSALGKLEINLVANADSAPEIVACIGAGFGPGADSIEASRMKIEPGAKALLMKFEKPQSGNFGGSFPDKWVEWAIKKGKYDLSFRYSMTLRNAAIYKMKPVFTGILDSNVVKVTVD